MPNRHCRALCAALAATAFVLATPLAASQDRPRTRARRQPPHQTVAPADSPDLRLQVGLDRAGFSPGEIDGHRGLNTTRALEAFAGAHKLRATDDDAVLRALSEDNAPVVTTYMITAADAAGPFTPDIPSDLEQQATLDALNYSSLEEALSERFHASPALLKRLNPDVTLEAGAEIQVPNVRVADDAAGSTPAAKVTVSRHRSAAAAYDASGRMIFYAPVTSGSTHDPLPLGTWKVTGISRNPSFNYNPELFWDANPSHTKAKIAPGPNNPVGVVWIDISKEHYGLHGTPSPSTIARTTSHGCVRLTNWDASRLAGLVKVGTPVIFEE
ncbi:MAG TPA: L,D-transpeptidase [Vicinamibacterales bacterium]|nr:L,D-transpeptidase [Vicinamibacterales bacterium]